MINRKIFKHFHDTTNLYSNTNILKGANIEIHQVQFFLKIFKPFDSITSTNFVLSKCLFGD
jgi:hypothetical protein